MLPKEVKTQLPDCWVTLGDRNELTMLGHDIAFFC